MKKIIVTITYVILFICSFHAQLSRFFKPQQNFYTINQQVNAYFDSLRTTLGDTVLSGEGSEYAEYQRFFNFWAPRLSSHGDFEIYFQALRSSLNNYSSLPIANSDPWMEIGPKVKPSCNIGACYASGIGPIEHISIFQSNPQYMLCSSLRGGVFYSQNGGLSWNKTGTDTKVPLSGMARAIFHPTNHNIWFASSGSPPQEDYSTYFIMYTGGVFRTMDEGQTWTNIADYNVLGGPWNKIWELKIDPSNPNILFVATEYGLYKTNNALSPTPAWSQIPSLSGKKVYDIDFKPQNSQVMYATVYDVTTGWKFMQSNDGGNTWFIIPGQPSTLGAKFLTIEVSNALPDNLYCLIGIYNNNYTCGSESPVWLYNTNTGIWQPVNSNNKTRTSFGGGFNFAVNQVDGSEIFVGCGSELKKMIINGSTTTIVSAYYNFNSYHPDIEFIICHPYNSNEVWMACHGGVYQSTDHGATWIDRSNGLGVTEGLAMATAYTDESHILVGAYHDGSMHTISPYSNNWNPGWKTVTGGDGLRPLIDNTDAKYMWTSSQQGAWYFSQDYGNSFSLLGCNYYSCYNNWSTEGVLNKVNPSFLYRFINILGHPEVGRSFDRGITNESISNFSSIYTNYILWKLYTPQSNGNYLLVHTIVQNVFK